jgi:aspartate/methionine/tyrosine aminotransferase
VDRFSRQPSRWRRRAIRILKLNIGNPAPFGFEAPDAILVDMIRHLPHAQGYSDSRGIFSARTAVSQYYQTRGIQNIHVDDIYLGNGVSELITMSLMALLDDGDEVLDSHAGLPAVDGFRGARQRQAGALPLRRGIRLAA